MRYFAMCQISNLSLSRAVQHYCHPWNSFSEGLDSLFEMRLLCHAFSSTDLNHLWSLEKPRLIIAFVLTGVYLGVAIEKVSGLDYFLVRFFIALMGRRYILTLSYAAVLYFYVSHPWPVSFGALKEKKKTNFVFYRDMCLFVAAQKNFQCR